jgi:uncharacterized membrane protein YbhN (UPF0104 family)
MIILATYAYIYKQIIQKNNFSEFLNNLDDTFQNAHFILLFCLGFILVFINWGIESLKWKYLIKKIEVLSFSRSVKAVLSGISVSIFTPNRIGEYFGRAFILEKANRFEGVLITIIGSISQLLITIIFGSISLIFFIPEFFDISEYFYGYFFIGLVVSILLILTLLLIFFFNIKILTSILESFSKKKWVKFRKRIKIFSQYSKKELFTVLMLSFLRYIIFTLQFFILLKAFSVDVKFSQSIMIISIIFLVMTALPTVTLAELGIRGSVTLYFFGLYFEKQGILLDQSNIGIILASSAIWIINLAIPALFGTVFVFNLKFFRKNPQNN